MLEIPAIESQHAFQPGVPTAETDRRIRRFIVDGHLSKRASKSKL